MPDLILKKYRELFFTENCEKIDNANLLSEPLYHILCFKLFLKSEKFLNFFCCPFLP